MRRERFSLWEVLTALSKENMKECERYYKRRVSAKEAVMYYFIVKLKIDFEKPPQSFCGSHIKTALYNQPNVHCGGGTNHHESDMRLTPPPQFKLIIN